MKQQQTIDPVEKLRNKQSKRNQAQTRLSDKRKIRTQLKRLLVRI